MDLEKLARCQEDFLERYPGGFAHPDMQVISKKHRVEAMVEKARTFFSPEALSEPLLAAHNLARFVASSSLISVFEKPKFRDYLASLPGEGALELISALRQRLYGESEEEQEEGFNRYAQVLALAKLAHWPLLTLVPVYVYPQDEVFMKPTTVKGIISSFSLDNLSYSPKPSWALYTGFRKALTHMKESIDPSLKPNNPAFSGFLMYYI